MGGWVWMDRIKRWVGCGDLQDGLLQHYQEMVPLSDWDIERRVRKAETDGDDPFDLRSYGIETRLHASDGESDDPDED